MKRIWLFLSLLIMLNAGEDFISHYEYGEMLYNNPRGVSCAQCHGEDGSGTIIVELKEQQELQTISGTDIRNKSLEMMIESVNRYHEIMPRYYLTNEEVKAIYDFIRKKNKLDMVSEKKNSNP